MLIRKRRGWEIAERDATPENVYLSRRQILRGIGVATVGASGLWGARSVLGAPSQRHNARGIPEAVRYTAGPAGDLYPADPHPWLNADNAGRPITAPDLAHAYNNFYEFYTPKHEVWRHTADFETDPWTLEVTGLVDNGGTFDLDDLMRRLPMEERVCRIRCVEAWSAVIPWTGFPLAALVDHVQPRSDARYIAMYTAYRPDQMPGVPNQDWYPWPYHEGLTIEEARNELSFLATGSYGKPQPKQNGAPLRLVVPWKFGFKNIKSIDRMVFTNSEPPTFWSRVTPNEYGFWANINPDVPHRRWSQARETFINTGDLVPTRMYNGYGEWVAHMYEPLQESVGDWLYR